MPEAIIHVLLSVGGVVLHASLIAVVLLAEKRQPSATLAWVFAIIFLPFLGALAYLLIGTTRARRVARHTQKCADRIREVLDRHDVGGRMKDVTALRDVRTPGFLALAERLSTTPASTGNQVEILVNASAAYRAMIEAVEAATSHIHVEFYIIQPDRTGAALRDRLARRASEGIRVRVLCDGLGSGSLPSDFWQPLLDAGGEAAAFHPVSRWLTRFRRRDRVDFRNHRKIVIVDGTVGFTGGINIGNEYLGLDPDMGHWRDTHLRIEGPAVFGLQATFVEDWLAATERVVDDDVCFPEPKADGGCVVQIVDSGPDRRWSPISHVFMQAYAGAYDRIWITSPYFVPSPEIYETLLTAALRGVDVRLLLPSKADSLLVGLAARSYYRRLLDAGVRIYHYESVGWRWRRRGRVSKGFIHAKTLVVDDWVGTIGSANMDMRSFQLNFELNAFVLDQKFASDLADQFRSDLEDASAFTLADLDAVGIFRRLAYQSARLLSPLL